MYPCLWKILETMSKMEINFAEICRTCLRKPTDFKDINESNANNITFGKMVEYCTSIPVDNIDILSSNICMDCVKELEISYKFKRKTENTHASLTKYLESRVQNIKTEEVIIKDEPSDSNLLHSEMYPHIPAREESLNSETNLHTILQEQSFSPEESTFLNNGGDESGEESCMSDNCSSDIIRHKVQLIDDDVKLEPAEEGQYTEVDQYECPVCLEKFDGWMCAKCEATEASSALKSLPEKSRRRYKIVYSKFMLWCKLKKIRNYSENCLLEYFQTITRKKCLWSTYSMLKACLLIHNDVDISKFTKLTGFIRNETRDLKSKTLRVFQSDEIDRFIREAPDDSFLLLKAVVIMGISGACRREELCKMCIDDLEFKEHSVIVNVPEKKTDVFRRFSVVNSEWLACLLKYTNLRSGTNKRFFLTYKHGKCINSPVGLNTMGKIPCRVAQYLQLRTPKEYTGHSFRRSSVGVLANSFF